MPIITKPITVTHEEMAGSPTESGSDSRFTATRVLMCAWADRLTLFDELFNGYEVTTGTSGTGYITSTIGQQYPHRNGVFVSSVSIEPFTNKGGAHQGDTTKAEWTDAKLTVQYEPRNFDPAQTNATSALAAGVAEETLDPSILVLQPPSATTVYLDTPTTRTAVPGNNRAGIIIRTLQWNYSLTKVKSIPSGWDTYQGYINSATVTSVSLNRTFAAETLLFSGYRARRSYTTAMQSSGSALNATPGARAWDVTLSFVYNPRGWNKFPSSSGAFYSLYSASSGGSVVKPYADSTDFAANLNL